MTKGLVYYTHHVGDPRILDAVRAQLARATALPIVSIALNVHARWPRPITCNGILQQAPSYLAMFRQILAGLEILDTDVAYLCEHDVAYHPSHFAFTPARMDTFYYNQHTWRVNADTGQAVFYYCNQVSGLCASRVLLIEHYQKVVALVEADGFPRSLGFEPGGNARQQRLDPHPVETWMSAGCNVDIKSGSCLTKWRGSPDQFRNKQTCLGWQLSDSVPGWGLTKGRFWDFLAEARPS